ncbi:MAG: hypothetical protein IPJ90_21740 [Anaerolineaceae bacterium]|nr:hypothetical protein [Anaerolineaceae bacterium]
MKRVWTLLLLLCATAVFLTACTNNQAAEAVVPTEPPRPTANVTATETVATGSLSQIGQTGQPQLLNAYASW